MTDAAGNSDQATAYVVVKDDLGPEISAEPKKEEAKPEIRHVSYGESAARQLQVQRVQGILQLDDDVSTRQRHSSSLRENRGEIQ